MILLLASCGTNSQQEPPASKAPTLVISGSESMTRSLLPALVETFQRQHPENRVAVSGGGTGRGIRALLDGRSDLAAASRPHSPADQEQAKANGQDLTTAARIIGVDVVSVSVHENSPLQALTYDQVIGIFCTHTIDDRTFLDPALGSAPIHAYTRGEGSGTRAIFEDFFCGPDGIHDSVQVADNETIRTALEADPHAISFATMTQSAGRSLALRASAAAPIIEPSQRNIANGSYPLYRDLYLYTFAGKDSAASTFIDWILSPAGQEIVDEQFFVPIHHRPAGFDSPRPLRETVHFEIGSSAPDQHSLARIQLLVDELRQRSEIGQHIVLEGYTDDREPSPVKLSLDRANAVEQILKEALPGSFFEIIPRGGIRPLAPNDTPFGRSRNRRVQVYLAAEEAQPDAAVVTPAN